MTDVHTVVVAITEAQRQLTDGTAGAVAVSETGRWSSPHYWEDDLQREVFETLVATACVEEEDRAVVFVTSVLTRRLTQRIDFRSPLNTPDVDEEQHLFGLSIDADNGFDVLRCPVRRLEDGTYDFGDIEIFEGNLQITPSTPGFQLLQGLLAA